jgi:hypothetical protein
MHTYPDITNTLEPKTKWGYAWDLLETCRGATSLCHSLLERKSHGVILDANDSYDEINKEMGNEIPCPEWTYIQK